MVVQLMPKIVSALNLVDLGSDLSAPKTIAIAGGSKMPGIASDVRRILESLELGPLDTLRTGGVLDRSPKYARDPKTQRLAPALPRPGKWSSAPGRFVPRSLTDTAVANYAKFGIEKTPFVDPARGPRYQSVDPDKLYEYPPDFLIAFPGTTGTQKAINSALKNNVPVLKLDENFLRRFRSGDFDPGDLSKYAVIPTQPKTSPIVVPKTPTSNIDDFRRRLLILRMSLIKSARAGLIAPDKVQPMLRELDSLEDIGPITMSTIDDIAQSRGKPGPYKIVYVMGDPDPAFEVTVRDIFGVERIPNKTTPGVAKFGDEVTEVVSFNEEFVRRYLDLLYERGLIGPDTSIRTPVIAGPAEWAERWMLEKFQFDPSTRSITRGLTDPETGLNVNEVKIRRAKDNRKGYEREKGYADTGNRFKFILTREQRIPEPGSQMTMREKALYFLASVPVDEPETGPWVSLNYSGWKEPPTFEAFKQRWIKDNYKTIRDIRSMLDTKFNRKLLSQEDAARLDELEEQRKAVNDYLLLIEKKREPRTELDEEMLRQYASIKFTDEAGKNDAFLRQEYFAEQRRIRSALDREINQIKESAVDKEVRRLVASAYDEFLSKKQGMTLDERIQMARDRTSTGPVSGQRLMPSGKRVIDEVRDNAIYRAIDKTPGIEDNDTLMLFFGDMRFGMEDMSVASNVQELEKSTELMWRQFKVVSGLDTPKNAVERQMLKAFKERAFEDDIARMNYVQELRKTATRMSRELRIARIEEKKAKQAGLTWNLHLALKSDGPSIVTKTVPPESVLESKATDAVVNRLARKYGTDSRGSNWGEGRMAYVDEEENFDTLLQEDYDEMGNPVIKAIRFQREQNAKDATTAAERIAERKGRGDLTVEEEWDDQALYNDEMSVFLERIGVPDFLRKDFFDWVIEQHDGIIPPRAPFVNDWVASQSVPTVSQKFKPLSSRSKQSETIVLAPPSALNSNYQTRTYSNARQADITIAIASNPDTPGERLTRQAARGNVRLNKNPKLARQVVDQRTGRLRQASMKYQYSVDIAQGETPGQFEAAKPYSAIWHTGSDTDERIENIVRVLNTIHETNGGKPIVINGAGNGLATGKFTQEEADIFARYVLGKIIYHRDAKFTVGTVISGGQNGYDIAFSKAAKFYGLDSRINARTQVSQFGGVSYVVQGKNPDELVYLTENQYRFAYNLYDAKPGERLSELDDVYRFNPDDMMDDIELAQMRLRGKFDYVDFSALSRGLPNDYPTEPSVVAYMRRSEEELPFIDSYIDDVVRQIEGDSGMIRDIFTVYNGTPESLAFLPGLQRLAVATFINRYKSSIEATQQAPTSTQVFSRVKSIAMNFKDGDRGLTMMPQYRGKSTMDLILEGSRTGTSRTRSQLGNVKAGDIVEFKDNANRTVRVRVTSDPVPMSQVPQEVWSAREGWDAATYERLASRGYWHYTYEVIK